MVGTGGFDPHGSMTPDHDAATDLKLRQRSIREIGRQLIPAVLLIAAALVLLALLTLATGTF
jgi:hypothetical protein